MTRKKTYLAEVLALREKVKELETELSSANSLLAEAEAGAVEVNEELRYLRAKVEDLHRGIATARDNSLEEAAKALEKLQYKNHLNARWYASQVRALKIRGN